MGCSGATHSGSESWWSASHHRHARGGECCLVDWVAAVLQRTLSIVKRPRKTQGFRVLQWRWIVERTFGWLNRSRRLSKDFEALPETTETLDPNRHVQLMIRRLAAKT